MEKKLTDEEIVKGLECLLTDCSGECEQCLINGCAVINEDFYDATFNLINRLQSKNKELRERKETILKDYYAERQTCDEQKDIITEQKSEIERLTEEKEDIIGRKAGLEYSYNQVKEKNDELQKQVDELSHENDELEYRAEQLEKQLTQAVKDTAKEIYRELYNYSKRHNWHCISPNEIETFAYKRGVECCDFGE